MTDAGARGDVSLRTLVALLVASSLVAGCLGGLPTSDSRDLPAWTDGEEVNGTALRQAHAEALLDAGSWTFRREISSERDGPQPSDWLPDQFQVTRWNESQGRYGSKAGVTEPNDDHRSAAFVGDGVRYTLSGSSDHYEYDAVPTNETEWSFDPRMERSADSVAHGLDRWNLTYAGTVERDGLVLLKFTGSGYEPSGMRVPGRVANASMTLLVREDGLVRRQTIRFEGTSSARPGPNERETVNVTVERVRTWRGVGSTTVERPEWVATAREREARSVVRESLALSSARETLGVSRATSKGSTGRSPGERADGNRSG